MPAVIAIIKNGVKTLPVKGYSGFARARNTLDCGTLAPLNKGDFGGVIMGKKDKSRQAGPGDNQYNRIFKGECQAVI